MNSLSRRTVKVVVNNDALENLRSKIRKDQIRLIFDQIPLGLCGQFLIILCLFIGLIPISKNSLLVSWFVYMTLCSILWFSVAILFKQKNHLLPSNLWLNLFAFFTTVAGIGWGFSASMLIPSDYLVHQVFVITIIVGMTAAANPFFSPIYYIYLLFLLPTFSPLVVWFFLHGNLFVLLGFCSIVYILVMAVSSYYSNKFLLTSLSLRYKNIDLDSLNQFLEKKIAERTRDLEKSLALSKSTLESTADGILVVDLNGNIDYCNQKFLIMWGITQEFLEQHKAIGFFNNALLQLKNSAELITKTNELEIHISAESFDELHFKNGNVFECFSKPHKVRRKIIGRVWNFSDITLRKKMERQLSYQANHDIVSGLPNRTLLYDRIQQGIAYAKRIKTSLALFFLDIDNFKLINDTLGHEAGDILLKEIAERLQHCIRQSDTVARFGGDEFVVLFVTGEHKDLMRLANKILKQISKPINLLNHELLITASMGISVYPKDGTDADTLLKNADMAMYLAKNQGKNNSQFFEESINEKSKKSLERQIELRNGLEKEEFFLLYQPIFNLKTGQIIAVEALIRWHHPQDGIISPVDFIPIAEESGFIVPLGEWVFREACRQYKEWELILVNPPRIAVNVSAIQLKKKDFFQMVKKVLAESHVPPNHIELELTESSIMVNTQFIISELEKLKKLGIHISIDDFGTGYSSLNYLRQFPIGKLKIDRSFVQNCSVDTNNAFIVEAMIAMGRGLKLTVLAEGIENKEQLQFLNEHGCHEGQGYYYSPPVDAFIIAQMFKK